MLLDSTSRWDSVLLFIRTRVSLGPTSLRRALHLVLGLVARLLRLLVGLVVVLLGPAACRWAHCLSIGPTFPRSARCVVDWPIVSLIGPPFCRLARCFFDWPAVSLIGRGLARRVVDSRRRMVDSAVIWSIVPPHCRLPAEWSIGGCVVRPIRPLGRRLTCHMVDSPTALSLGPPCRCSALRGCSSYCG